MSSHDSHDEPFPDSGPAFSREVLTPRGGFMARPGLKPPPRHAVVVRGGDAPVTEAIPVARSSFPPPAPPSEPTPASPSVRDKATLKAIPSAKVPHIASVAFDELAPSPRASAPAPSYVALESVPPPSDAPLVQSIPPVSSGPRPRSKASGWAVFAAGAAGLILGLASVLATRGSSEDEGAVAAAAAGPMVEPPPVVEVPSPPAEAPAPETSASAAPAVVKVAAPAVKAPLPPVKKSIF